MFLSERFETLTRRIAVVSVIGLVCVLPVAEKVLPLHFFQEKRRFEEHLRQKKILATLWSPLSRVDIASNVPKSGPLKGKKSLAVWIDGGTNASVILPWDGNLSTLKPITEYSIGAVHSLKSGTGANVLTIGSSGGREVFVALSHGAGHVDAIEMDPGIAHFVTTEPFAKFSGHLFSNERVRFLNDEGRAFLRSQAPESYDIIQFVNNYTPIAMAAGALNLSETFLMTKEAFKDYFIHLKPDGVLALHRGAALRVALTAIQALEELGIPNPERHIFITNGEFEAYQGFFLKKSEWRPEEVDHIHDFLKP